MLKKYILAFAIILPFLIGCRRDEVDEKVGCNCEGKAATVVTDAPAQISNTPGRSIFFKDGVRYNGLNIGTGMLLCDTTKLNGLPTSEAGVYDYLVSGNVRPPCDGRGFAYIWRLEITSIRKK